MNITLSQLVARVESNNCPQAVRHEPGFGKYVTATAIGNCIAAFKVQGAYMNKNTAREICKMSFGLYQIMGENLYTVCNIGMTVFDFVMNEDAQLVAFQKYCFSRKILYSLDEILHDKTKRENFALRYNGSRAYAETIMQHARAMKLL